MRSSLSARAHATGLFDVQQHTFSHVPFKDIVYSPEPGLVGTIPAAPPEALLEELAFTSRLIREHVGGDVRRPAHAVRLLPRPARPARPARDRPRRPGSATSHRGAATRRTRNPTPWVQPFAYAEEGYPDILELPFQFWLDVVWFDQHGYDTGPGAARGAEGRRRRGGRARPRLRRLLPRLGDARLGRAPRRLAARLPPLRARARRRGDDLHGVLAALAGA